MKVEDDGSLTLHQCDLLDGCRTPPPDRPEPAHFIREARVAAHYASGAGHRVVYVGPGCMEVMDRAGRWL